MKKYTTAIILMMIVLSLCACTPNNNAKENDSPSASYHSTDNNDDVSYDYDKGYGYTAPEPGQSFSDYVKEQDPDLYDSITDNYSSAIDDYDYGDDDDYDYDKGFGYTAPKPGQSFSDYVKEQDPDLYNSLFG